MTESKKDHPCRKPILKEIDFQIAQVLAAASEDFIGLDRLLEALKAQFPDDRFHVSQLKKRLKTLARAQLVRLHKNGQLVGKGQLFVNLWSGP